MVRPLLLSGLLLLAGAACAEDPGPSDATGSLRVITHTSGAAPDTNGYTVTITGHPAQVIEVNDTVTFLDLPINDYGITIGNVAVGCIVADGNPRTRYVSIGTTTEDFFITCS